MKERMARGWRSGLPETLCGAGATLASTERIRAWLPCVVERYAIASVCDAGAGDMGWIRRVEWKVAYRPFDLVPRHPDVTEIDITSAALPACDLILCRAVLNHLSPAQVADALERFRTAARYLLATQFSAGGARYSDWEPYDLRTFGLGEPIDGCPDNPGALALWSL
jgi:hypothetical protein